MGMPPPQDASASPFEASSMTVSREPNSFTIFRFAIKSVKEPGDQIEHCSSIESLPSIHFFLYSIVAWSVISDLIF